ncbi:MAG: ribonuclease III [Candidatus Omnitrophica bacterium]|nr:ribonuclease III [Candidatus Omnitrophota bacterium]
MRHTKKTLKELQRLLKVPFKDLALLDHALTHSSYKYELHNQPQQNDITVKEIKDNERLEFFGDSILSFLICKKLYTSFPDLDEGTLSKYRSLVVSRKQLFTIAKKLKLHKFLYLGRGEHNIPFLEKAKMMADALEAIIAAIYLDRGIDIVEKFIGTHFDPYLVLARLKRLDAMENYKNKLQECCQRDFQVLPQYKTVAHGEEFSSTVHIHKKKYGTGSGRSKRIAEKEAAKETLKILRKKKR